MSTRKEKKLLWARNTASLGEENLPSRALSGVRQARGGSRSLHLYQNSASLPFPHQINRVINLIQFHSVGNNIFYI